MLKAQPILKWAGGKRRLAPLILKALPAKIDTYYEPFLGGGAVFFALAAEKRFRRAVLSDCNPDLVSAYRAVRDDAEGVIRCLQRMRHSEVDYYRIRGSRPRSSLMKAARTIYLNKTGFNGLYRLNRAGDFNVPFGRYTNPTICDVDGLRAASRALAGVSIEAVDFEESVELAAAGDAVYFDPPYVPASKTANFTAFYSEAFGSDEHARLAQLFMKLAGRGVHVVLSNSDTPETRKLYSGFRRKAIRVQRHISADGKSRGPVGELLVSGARSVRKGAA